MINSELGHVTSVEEFNKEIRRQQEEAHGEDYCLIHDAISKYSDGCKNYMELGTHQGGTASVALLQKFNRIQLVDIDLSRYNKFLKPLAEAYAKENNIELDVRQADSHSMASLGWSDMLVIDSYHHPAHMRKELELHGNTVRKYIIAHDTSVLHGNPNESLYYCLKDWAEENNWKVVERCTDNVGYTVIERTK